MDAAELASAAFTGALLWDPERARDVVDWLDPEDLHTGAHQAIYQTIIGLQAAGRPVDLQQMPAILRRGEFHDMHVARDGSGPLSAPALHSLLAITPATPSSSAHGIEAPRSEHVRYARLVLEASIRRQVTAVGTRIRQYAHHLPGHRSEDAAALLQPVLTETVERLRELTARLDAADPSRSRIRAALAPAPIHRPLPGRRSTPSAVEGSAVEGPDAHVVGDGRPAPTPAQLTRAEHALIGACTISEPVRELAQRSLSSDDFSDPAAATTWLALNELRRRGEPIDVVLLAAETERLSGDPDLPPGIPAGELLRLSRNYGDLAAGYQTLEVVARAVLTRAGLTTGSALHDVAEDPARSGNEVLRAAQHAVAEMNRVVHRVSGSAPIGAALGALTALTPPEGIPAPRGSGELDGTAPPITGSSGRGYKNLHHRQQR